MKKVNTIDAPKAIGPYSQGYLIDGLVFVSGQTPVNPKTGKVALSIDEQAKESCENVKAVLKAAGTDMNHVVKTTCFLANMTDFEHFNHIYGAYFSSKPARSCVAVKALPENVLCEIEAIAVL